MKMRWHKCDENWSESHRRALPPAVFHHIRASVASLPSFLIHWCKNKPEEEEEEVISTYRAAST